MIDQYNLSKNPIETPDWISTLFMSDPNQVEL